MACSNTSFLAWAASPTNQPRSRPDGSGSQAPVKCQPLSHNSTHVWLPRLLAQSGVPTRRAGTQTDRHASQRMIDSPVHEAFPCSIDCDGLWFAAFRSVEYLTFTFLKTNPLSFWAASPGVLQSLTTGRHMSKNSLRQASRFSSMLAYGSTSLRKSSSGMSLPHGTELRALYARSVLASRKSALRALRSRSGMLATRKAMPARWSFGAPVNAFSSSARLSPAFLRATATESSNPLGVSAAAGSANATAAKRGRRTGMAAIPGDDGE